MLSAADTIPEAPSPQHWARRPALISVVVPIFREEEGIEHFTDVLTGVLDRLALPYEVIFVEDDSPDASLEQIRVLHRRRPDVIRALSMSRRFGHQASLAAGFDACRGDVVICLDGDLQHPPELIPVLLSKWADGFQLVYTRRRRQEGRGRLKEFMSGLFYSVINRVTEVRFEDGTADFRLMDRLVVDALRRCGERSLFYRGLVQWAGFRRTAIDYVAPPRFAGSSSYTWSRMFRLGIDAVFTYSLVPLRACYYVGGIFLACTLLYAAWAFASWCLGRTTMAGYTSLVLLLSMIGSLHMIGLGIVGEYVGRIHEQVKNRPLYLVKESIGTGQAIDSQRRDAA
jgi:polyisoprenyl-phosphate glycosyltransferase